MHVDIAAFKVEAQLSSHLQQTPVTLSQQQHLNVQDRAWDATEEVRSCPNSTNMRNCSTKGIGDHMTLG